MDGTKRGFTLVEILIAIAILGVLSAASFVAINPSERFKQSRDTERVADISNLNTLISQKRYSHVRRDLGDVQVVYISLPDTSATCSSYTLPTLPSGWTYACVTQENVLNVDGTGWLPVDISESRAMSALPLDPLNTQDYFYAYTIDSNEAFVLTAALESEEKLKGTATTDGGNDDIRFEKGTNLALWDEASGLVAYWPLDEGEGDTVKNFVSGGGDGTLFNNPTFLSTDACKKGRCLSFDGDDDYVALNMFYSSLLSEFSVSAWVNIPSDGGNWSIVDFDRSQYFTCAAGIPNGSTNGDGDYVGFHTTADTIKDMWSNSIVRDSTWHHIVWTFDSSGANDKKIYIDGTLDSEANQHGGNNIGTGTRYGFFGDGSEASTFNAGRNNLYYKGSIDEIRMYERALNADEISRLYKSSR